MTAEVTAGTAGDGYLTTPAVHPFDPAPADYGERPHCRRCQREAHQHLPVPRRPGGGS